MVDGRTQLLNWMKRNLPERGAQAELARRIGVKPGAVWNWLRGQRTPDRDKAIAIQAETGIPVAAWLRMKGAA